MVSVKPEDTEKAGLCLGADRASRLLAATGLSKPAENVCDPDLTLPVARIWRDRVWDGRGQQSEALHGQTLLTVRQKAWTRWRQAE